MGIVWIASYPKSGNTWMRFLLANYFAGPIRDSSQVEYLIPGFSPGMDGASLVQERGTVYGKTHWMWGPRHPCARLTERAVVIIRHPKDVLLSNLNYTRLASGSEKAFSDASYARSFIQYGGDPRWVMTGFGTLEQNVSSWMDGMQEQSRLIIRYEDLKADCAREMTRVLAFLGLPLEQERLQTAVAQSTFDQMRAIEVKEKRERRDVNFVFPGPTPRPGWARYFMNAGKVRGSIDHIESGLDAAFDKRFAPLMKRFGYDGSGAP